MFGSLTWGFLLIALGVTILINALFGINIPFFKILFAGFFIYLGISMLTDLSFSCKRRCNVYFGTESMETLEQDYYRVRFGNSTINLTQFSSLTEKKTVTIQPHFANVTVLLPARIPVRVIADATFSSVHFPDGSTLSFGKREYCALHGTSEPLLTVIIDGAFSTVTIKS